MNKLIGAEVIERLNSQETLKQKKIWSLHTLPQGTEFRVLNLVQSRFPRSKRVRLRKKWANNPANWRQGKKVRSHFMVKLERYQRCEPPPCPACEAGLPRSIEVPLYDYRTGRTISFRMSENKLAHAFHERETPFPGNFNIRIVRDDRGFYQLERV